jgi:hypothetical protein
VSLLSASRIQNRFIPAIKRPFYTKVKPEPLQGVARNIAKQLESESVVVVPHSSVFMNTLEVGKNTLVNTALGFNSGTPGVFKMSIDGREHFYYTEEYTVRNNNLGSPSINGNGPLNLLTNPFVSKVVNLHLLTEKELGGRNQELKLQIRLRFYKELDSEHVNEDTAKEHRVVIHRDNSLSTLVTPLLGDPLEGQLEIIPLSRDSSQSRDYSRENIVVPSTFGNSVIFTGINQHWVRPHVGDRISLVTLLYHPAEYLE